MKDFALNQSRQPAYGNSLDWTRFSEYEILEHENKYLIIPSKNAKYIHYHPLKEGDLLNDFLELGKWYSDEVFENETTQNEFSQKRQAHRVLSFCNRYGLLGLAWVKLAGRIRSDGPKESRKTMSENRAQWDKIISPHIPRMNSMPPFSVPYERPMREYAEDASEIMTEASGMYFLAKCWKTFYEYHATHPGPYEAIQVDFGGGQPPQEVPWAAIVALSAVHHISVFFDPFENSQGLSFGAQSLLPLIQVSFLTAISSRTSLFHLCDECGTPFTAKDPRAKFCSLRCSNRSRQRRFQEKKKAAAPKTVVKTVGELPLRGRKASAQKTVAISAQKTVVKTVGELSTKQGKTGEKPRKRKTR